MKSAESVVQATFSCKKLQRRGPRHRPADYSRPCSRTRLQGCRVVGFGVYGFRVLGFTGSGDIHYSYTGCGDTITTVDGQNPA